MTDATEQADRIIKELEQREKFINLEDKERIVAIPKEALEV